MSKSITNRSWIPFHVPDIGEEEINEVVDTLRSGWVTTGPRTERFESDFRDYLGCRHALAVNSGTAGLHLALAACGIGPGDEVITTPLTFCATVNVILHVGATPVLADVGPDGNIDPSSIADRITPRTAAIMPVHLAGKPCDMDAIWEIARRHKLRVIEDAAHSVEARYRGLTMGSPLGQSDAVAFSFYATKNMTTGEGGMVVTNDESLDQKMRSLCLHGISRDAWNRYKQNGSWFYQVLSAGFKYNMSDIQAAMGIHQLRKLDRLAERRKELVGLYKEELGGMPQLELPEDASDGCHSWHLFAIRLNLDKLTIDRREFIEQLNRSGVGTSVHFIPIQLHPFFEPWADLSCNYCPRALALYERIVSLPLYPSLTNSQIKEISDRVKQIVETNTRTSRRRRSARRLAAAAC